MAADDDPAVLDRQPCGRKGDGPHAFVADKNLHRRYLSESQRAVIAAGMATMKKGENLHPRSGAQIPSPTITAARASELLNVSRSSIVEARTVLEKGTREEIQAVRDGCTAFHRRHLSPTQLGMIGARMANLRLGYNQFQKKGIGIPIPSVSVASAASLLNISQDTIFAGRVILNEGTPMFSITGACTCVGRSIDP